MWIMVYIMAFKLVYCLIALVAKVAWLLIKMLARLVKLIAQVIAVGVLRLALFVKQSLASANSDTKSLA